MVTFDAAEPGTPAEIWESDPCLHNRPLIQIGHVEEVIVVAPHPDDETLGAGGVIAHCEDSGIPVHVVCVTDGAGPNPARTDLARIRAAELQRSVRILAPSARVTLLAFPDGQTREHRDDITQALREIVFEAARDCVIVGPWRGDGHRDHRVVAGIVQDVAAGRRVWEYPIWMWHWAHPTHPDTPWTRMVSCPIDAERKARAIGAFTSQTAGPHPMLRPEFLENFHRDKEMFIMSDDVLGRDYFDRMYDKSDDPWRFRTRWYEDRKRQVTLAALPHPRYGRALEIGCSIGVLTDLLASRCDSVLAVDISRRAVDRARARVAGRAEVRLQDILTDFPEGPFDLIVMSEVGYYWGASRLDAALSSIREHLLPGGVLLACHWRHRVDGYPLTGDDVHTAIARQGWSGLVHHEEEDFLLDVFSDDSRSVAKREGFV